MTRASLSLVFIGLIATITLGVYFSFLHGFSLPSTLPIPTNTASDEKIISAAISRDCSIQIKTSQRTFALPPSVKPFCTAKPLPSKQISPSGSLLSYWAQDQIMIYSLKFKSLQPVKLASRQENAGLTWAVNNTLLVINPVKNELEVYDLNKLDTNNPEAFLRQAVNSYDKPVNQLARTLFSLVPGNPFPINQPAYSYSIIPGLLLGSLSTPDNIAPITLGAKDQLVTISLLTATPKNEPVEAFSLDLSTGKAKTYDGKIGYLVPENWVKQSTETSLGKITVALPPKYLLGKSSFNSNIASIEKTVITDETVGKVLILPLTKTANRYTDGSRREWFIKWFSANFPNNPVPAFKFEETIFLNGKSFYTVSSVTGNNLNRLFESQTPASPPTIHLIFFDDQPVLVENKNTEKELFQQILQTLSFSPNY